MKQENTTTSRSKVENIKKINEIADSKLPEFLHNDDARQMLHITYGYILKNEEIKNRIFNFLKQHRKIYEAEIVDLYRRHFEALGYNIGETL